MRDIADICMEYIELTFKLVGCPMTIFRLNKNCLCIYSLYSYMDGFYTYTLLNNYKSLQAIYRPKLQVSNRLQQVYNTVSLHQQLQELCEMFCSISIFCLYFIIFNVMGANFTC